MILRLDPRMICETFVLFVTFVELCCRISPESTAGWSETHPPVLQQPEAALHRGVCLCVCTVEPALLLCGRVCQWGAPIVNI